MNEGGSERGQVEGRGLWTKVERWNGGDLAVA